MSRLATVLMVALIAGAAMGYELGEMFIADERAKLDALEPDLRRAIDGWRDLSAAAERLRFVAGLQ